MSTLVDRFSSLISAIGPDVKTIQSQIVLNEQAMLPTSPAQVLQCNMHPTLIVNSITSLTTGRLSMVRCPVRKGQQISAISFFAWNGAVLPNNSTFALYNPDRTLIGVTPTDGSASWNTNTRKRLVLNTPYTPSADGFVYVGVVVGATTMPTLAGISTALSVVSEAPILHGYSNTGVTPTTFPSTADALTPLAGVPAVMLD